MRLNFFQRFLRFMFMPMCAMAVICMLRYLPIYKQISEFCQRRNTCSSACTFENFPELPCSLVTLNLEYNKNEYTDFFVYPKPVGDGEHPMYDECAEFIDGNPEIPFAIKGDTDRQLRIHSCFHYCQTNADCLVGFDLDDRELCAADDPLQDSLLCVTPDTSCEVYVMEHEICLNEDKTLCLSWKNIWLAILLFNIA